MPNILELFHSHQVRQGINSLAHILSRLKPTEVEVFSPFKRTWIISAEINFRAG